VEVRSKVESIFQLTNVMFSTIHVFEVSGQEWCVVSRKGWTPHFCAAIFITHIRATVGRIVLLDDMEFKNNNHVVATYNTTKNGCTPPQIEIPGQGKAFDALQFHFHTGSDHALDGKYSEQTCTWFTKKLEAVAAWSLVSS
jgi:hypothetical protein